MEYNEILVTVSAILIFISLAAAIWIRKNPQQQICGIHNKTLAYSLVGAWTLLIPIWFIWEWYKFIPSPRQTLDDFKYSQDLARNVWVAMVVVLAKITGFEWGG